MGRSRLIAAAEAKLALPDGLLPTEQKIRALTIDLIRALPEATLAALAECPQREILRPG